jgi:predicted nucleotide-binding protein
MGVDVLLSLQAQPEDAQPPGAGVAAPFAVATALTSQASEPSLADGEALPAAELAARPVEGAIASVPATLADHGPARSGQVFLVHGRNEAYKQAVAGMLQGAGPYEVTILNERPAERLALIERFDDHTVDARYAVVLLTADDVGAPRLDSDREPYFSPRARQGVVFELGVLVAVLSPRCVCVLYEDGVELPCDLDRVTFVHLDAAGTWRSKLLLQLRAAGFDYDLNRLAPF